MTERGYYLISRGFLENPMFKNEPLTEREAFQWLIDKAAWKDRPAFRIRSAVIELKRGEAAYACEYLAKAWGASAWNKSRVWRVLQKFQRHGAVVLKTERDATRITLCNYDKHQRRENDNRNADETPVKRERNETEENKIIKLSEKVEARKRASQLPESFLLTDERRAVADRHGIPVARVAGVFEHFRDHHAAKGSVMKDWDAAWRTWCKNDLKFGGGRNGTGTDGKNEYQRHLEALKHGNRGHRDGEPVSEAGNGTVIEGDFHVVRPVAESKTQ